MACAFYSLPDRQIGAMTVDPIVLKSFGAFVARVQ
jgi:hypothetical protein